MKKTGIVGYGVYIPQDRITVEEIAKTWGKDSNEIINGLMVIQKAVAKSDEDAVTLGIEAARVAVSMAGISPVDIGSVYFGSESHPYVVNPSASILAEYLGVGTNYFAADLEFACKAATAGMQATVGLLTSGHIRYGLVVGSDIAQGRPHDALEYTAGSASAAFIFGSNPSEFLTKILAMNSYTSDTPDFWRRDGAKYPSHFGRFTAEPAYFTHLLGAGKKLLTQTNLKPQDFSYCVFHMPNGKFPRLAAAKLGFTKEQLAPSLTVEEIGNPYSASSLVGLCAVLDIAKPKEKIFFVSYGSGAGSDGFIFETTETLIKMRKQAVSFKKQAASPNYITYATYLRRTQVV